MWFDEWEIKPGDSIPAKIEDGLEHSRVLVLCMSAAALAADWPQLESHTFRFKDPLNHDRRFIPLRLDDAPIKGSLAQFLYINWRPNQREREYPKLLAGCRRPSEPLLTLKGHEDSVTALRWLSGGNKLLSTSYDGTVRLWEISQESVQSRVVWKADDRVLSIAVRADDTVAVSLRNGEITILKPPKWDVATKSFPRAKRSPTVYSLSWLADGCLVTSEDDGIARIINKSGLIQQEFVGHTNRVRTALLFPERNLVVTGSHDRSLRTWDIGNGKEVRCRPNAHSNDINALCRIGVTDFASSGDDGCVRLWRLTRTGKFRPNGVLRGRSRYVIELSLSSDGKILASKSSRRVCLWSIETKALIAEIEEPMEVSWPVGLAFHPPPAMVSWPRLATKDEQSAYGSTTS